MPMLTTPSGKMPLKKYVASPKSAPVVNWMRVSRARVAIILVSRLASRAGHHPRAHRRQEEADPVTGARCPPPAGRALQRRPPAAAAAVSCLDERSAALRPCGRRIAISGDPAPSFHVGALDRQLEHVTLPRRPTGLDAMDLLKDRLFIGTLCLTVGLTAAAGVALAYDINSNRGQTVAAVSGGTAQDEQ